MDHQFGGLVAQPRVSGAPAQARNDAEPHPPMAARPPGEKTVRAYAADVRGFLAFAPHGLRQVAVGDIQAYADSLARYAPAGRGAAAVERSKACSPMRTGSGMSCSTSAPPCACRL